MQPPWWKGSRSRVKSWANTQADRYIRSRLNVLTANIFVHKNPKCSGNISLPYPLITYTNNCFSRARDALNNLPASPVAMFFFFSYKRLLFFPAEEGRSRGPATFLLADIQRTSSQWILLQEKLPLSQYLIIEQRFGPELFHD